MLGLGLSIKGLFTNYVSSLLKEGGGVVWKMLTITDKDGEVAQANAEKS